MKNRILLLLVSLLFSNGFSQASNYEYNGRLTPSVSKEKLNAARSVGDITPELWHKMGLPEKERDELDYRRKTEYPLGYYLYPQGGYESFIHYVSVEISAVCNGQTLTAQSTGDQLSNEQKNILNTADLNTDISIKVQFHFKDKIKITGGWLAVTVVPETEAEYPGGFKQLTSYLMKNIFNKVSEPSASGKLEQAAVKFTINEEGQPVDAKLSRSSSDAAINKLILDAIAKMPKWKTAKNSKGIKIKQEYTIPFGSSGC